MAKLNTFLLIVVSATVMGCAAEPEQQLHEVEGTVTLDGEPLDRVHVEFWPATDGPRSGGTTDDQGRFVLTTYDMGEKKGAVASTHKVILRDNSVFKEGIEDLTPGEKRGMDLTSGKDPRIADKYTNIATTPLEIEITGPEKDINFEPDPYEG